MNSIWVAIIVYAIAGIGFAAIVMASDLIHRRELTWDFVVWLFGWGVLIVALIIGLAFSGNKTKK